MSSLTEIQNALVREGLLTPEEEFVTKLIAHIIFVRVKEGISQSELSRRSGVPQKTISRMENRLSLPSIQTLYKLAEAMDYKLNFELEKC